MQTRWETLKLNFSYGKNRFESIQIDSQAESILIDSTSEWNTGIFDSVIIEYILYYQRTHS